ncbi:hypothetical protein [Arenimonas sp.]|uniref:hypothetical protein n=1 Tax=Arenimonas sp. TaxID=1872635 RepID=UPI002E31BF8A|nr:hypothetical protein [Arenimonas sp.]HEX4854926.1 hypothetical protein [Arenimonas sp.]
MRRSELVPRLLFAGLLSLPALAAAQGGPDFKVGLDPETCAFSGGSDGAGNVEADAGSGNKMIQVRLDDPRDWGIAEVRFDGDGADQMVHAGGGEAHVVNIFNRNSGPADVKYSVVVQNKATGETRDCDPRIINR